VAACGGVDNAGADGADGGSNSSSSGGGNAGEGADGGDPGSGTNDDDGGASSGAPPPTPTAPPERGQATYYAADGTGSCSFPASPSNLDVAAMNAAQYGTAAYCGACLNVKGPKGSVVVRVVDKCPGCSRGSVDLSRQAFAKIADLSAGRVPIEWTVVPCDTSAPLSYATKDGSSRFWTAVQVRNHRVPIVKLEMEKGGVFVNAPRTDYNFFVLSGGVGVDAPFRVRVTSSTGQTLTDTLGTPRPLQTFTGTQNFR
jgi:expansin (peptidoglycan-binding protein)